MKALLSNLFAILFMASIAAPVLCQTPFTYSIHVGDARVYELKHTQHYWMDWSVAENCFIQTIYYNYGDKFLLYRSSKPPIGGHSDNTNSIVQKVNSRGMLMQADWKENWSEIYPISPPLEDSIAVGIDVFHVTRRFDTTVLNRPVRAFSGKMFDAGFFHEQSFVICDWFGLVCWSTSELDTLRLQSAVLDGTYYNRDLSRYDFLPVCSGNRYQYNRRESSLFDMTGIRMTPAAKDSVMNGKLYFLMNFYDSPRLYRSDSAGVWQGERLILPSNPSIGSAAYHSVVVDTSTAFEYGSWRRKIYMSISERDYSFRQIWLEGIGPIYMDQYSWSGESYTDTLLYASVCGEEFGTMVGVEPENTEAIPTTTSLGNYPNPFAEQTTISFKISGTVLQYATLCVYDIHGRLVEILMDGMADPGERTVSFKARNLPAGLYYYQLRMKDRSLTKKMVVRSH